MPKLRNGDTPVAMFTNWLGRKCRNHNPLSELLVTETERQKIPQIYRNKEAKINEVMLVSGSMRNKLVYHNGQVAFEIIVNEIPMSELEILPLEKVQH